MIQYQKLIAAAEDGALILTANERLFRYLRGRFDQAMQTAGRQVWDTPQIISYQGWLHRSLAELGEGWQLLGKNQALRIWESLIEQSCRGSELELLQMNKTAEKAYEAHQLLMEYGVTLDDSFLTDDQRVFYHWHKLFVSECQKRQWLDPSLLPARICQALTTGELTRPSQLFLVGFDQLPPGAETVQKSCQALGVECEQFRSSPESAGVKSLVTAQDGQHEIELAACWARRLLDAGEKSVGVVVFDLQARRRTVERIFRNQLDPAAAPGLLDDDASFTLSLGSPLVEQGAVHAACELLSLGAQLSLDQVSFLLRTPYLGGGIVEADQRAQLDVRIRSYRQSQFKLLSLENLAGKSDQLQKLQHVCQRVAHFSADKTLQLPGVWAERFAQQLATLGWPGERPLASSEYQVIKAWRDKLLPTLAALDPVSQPLGRSQALSLLRRFAADIEFQLESPTGPLQVLGQLESAGLCFDHLWVMGLSEQALPTAARPNPFIPYDLQQHHGMPHANAERELVFAEQVMARLQVASPDLIFSYPRWDGDCELRPSSLLPQGLTEIEPLLAESQDLLSQVRKEPSPLQYLTDEKGPALANGQGSGGTGILKDQAHCPFRAFVHHRLQGRELDTAAVGLDAMTRGDLVHLVLERLWRQLQEQQCLLALNESEQAVVLEYLIDGVVDLYFAKNRPSEQLLLLEKQRIKLLVTEWLDKVERKRDPFRVVESEQEHVEQLGPLQIKTKVDRIDELTGGQRVVIDYKTGTTVKADDLLTEPLLEPQLPIYAVAAAGDEAAGVAFAKVQRNDCRLIGVVRENGLLGKVKALDAYPQAAARGITDWSQLLADWRQQLEKLAEEFVAGVAAVRPYDLKRSCQYCDLSGLCRINEATSGVGGDDE